MFRQDRGKRFAGDEIKHVEADVRAVEQKFELSVVHEVARRNQRQHAAPRRNLATCRPHHSKELLAFERFFENSQQVVTAGFVETP